MVSSQGYFFQALGRVVVMTKGELVTLLPLSGQDPVASDKGNFLFSWKTYIYLRDFYSESLHTKCLSKKFFFWLPEFIPTI